MITVKLNVTEHDIANGKPSEANSCPIALAIERLFVDAMEILVEGNIFVYYPSHTRYRLVNTDQIDRVCAFIIDFDGGAEVKPFEMTLDFEEVIYEE